VQEMPADALVLDGTRDSLSVLRDFVQGVAGAAGLDRGPTYNLMLAVDEIATNIIVHAYEERNVSGILTVHAQVDVTSLRVFLEDEGPPYDPALHTMPTQEGLSQPLEHRSAGGLGVMLAKHGVDELNYRSADGRNVHEFVLCLRGGNKK
jgi:anti-sigma regulatory factor (Ser/Thr protein kinase)